MTDRASPLIEVGTLASELAGPRPPVVLDVRWRLAGPPGIDSYNEGHLPGAAGRSPPALILVSRPGNLSR